MDNIESMPATEGAMTSSLPTPKYPRSKKRLMMMLGIFVLLLVLLGVVLVIYTSQNKQAAEINDNSQNTNTTDNSDDENTDEDSDDSSELSIFSSSNYNLRFNYPKELGIATARLTPEYFNNEEVTFSEQPALTVSYWRFEGGFTAPIETETIESKEGYSFILNTHKNEDTYFIFASGDQDNGDGTSVTFAATIANLEETNVLKAQVRTIIQNLEFDLSEASNNEFISEHFNLSFKYSVIYGTPISNLQDSNQRCLQERITFTDASRVSLTAIQDTELGAQTCLPAGTTTINEYSRTSTTGNEFNVNIVNPSENVFIGTAVTSLESDTEKYHIVIELQSIMSNIVEAQINELIDYLDFEAGLK